MGFPRRFDGVLAMAVVRDFYIGATHICICDDCYRDAGPEEIERRRKAAQRVAWRIAMAAAAREAKKEAAGNGQAETEKPLA